MTPRTIVKRLARLIHARRDQWYLRLFGERLMDTRLWSMNRHSITAAFGIGVGISFIPLPVHMLLAALAAVIWRLNLPVAVASVYLINPFTMVPVYFAAYRVGAALLHYRPRHFEFHVTWNWLEHGLGPAWKPFLLGCLVCGICGGLLARYALAITWRYATLYRYHTRHRRERT